MAKQTVNIGVTANDNTGDPLRTAFDKLNDNFDEVYAAGPVGTNIQISDNTIASTNTNGNIDLDPAGTGKVLVNGPMDANGVVTLNSTVTGNIVPTSGNTYNLGSSSAPFKEAFISGGSLHIGGLVLKEVDTMLEIFQADGVTNAILSGNSTTSGTVLNNGNTVVALTQNGPITFFANNYQDGNATVTVINTSNITTPNVVTSGDVTATGNVTGDFILGTTAIVSTAAVQGATVVATGNINGGNLAVTGEVDASQLTSTGNINATGDVIATNLWGTLQVEDQPNVTGLGTLTDLQIAGDLSMTNAAAQIDCYDIHANGNINVNNISTTSDVSTATVSFTGDSSQQSRAYVEHFKFLDSNGSAVQSTLTDAFGVGVDAVSGKYYEFMAHLILQNDSTGTVEFAINADAGGADNAYVMYTGAAQYGAVTDTRQMTGLSGVTTGFNTAETFHIQLVGAFSASANTNVTFQIATSTGNVTPLAGSNFRFTEHSGNSVGSLS